MCELRLNPEDIEAIADAIIRKIFDRKRDEITMNEICKMLNISKDTIRRKYKYGLIPKPVFKRGENYFSKCDIDSAIKKGIL
jgi:response regulator of citrate/malate metabolism